MRDTCISAVEFFVRMSENREHIEYVKKHFPTATMQEFYAKCNDVTLLWWALGQCLLVRSEKASNPRVEQLLRADIAFRREYFKNPKRPSLEYADHYLTKKELKRWADRLRKYITPR